MFTHIQLHWDDTTRAAFMLAVTNGIGLGVISGLLNWDGIQVAAATSFVNSILILGMKVFSSGQGS